MRAMAAKQGFGYRPPLGCFSRVFGLWIVASCAANTFAIDFEADVATVLMRRCLECHNPRVAAGGLLLNSSAGLRKGGESGPAIEANDPKSSELLRRIISVSDDRMPPDRKGLPQPLPIDEIRVLQKWIASGAAWPEGRKLSLFERTNDVRGGRDWWSLQPLAKAQPPSPDRNEAHDLATNSWRRKNPVDAFILKRLRAEDLQPAPIADRRTRIRRLYLDMLGYPPTWEQIRAFEKDPSPDAWERLVDGVLASPQYGQRWSRYWLDLARYADTSGYERDQPKPFAWRYRDWVIDAHNSDLPYDRFIVEQIAGDQIPKRSRRSLIATGFLRLGTWNDEPNDPHDYKYERLEDLVHSTSSAFLGLTVKCARCHDHKFDPIPQSDYYRMAAVFWPGPIQPGDRKLLGGPSAEELGETDVLGWTDSKSAPSPFHVLKDGDRHKPQEQIAPGGLTFVPKLTGSFASDKPRLQLAQWLANRDNPLVARVIVNRLWLHHFGAGLVRTPNNFGFTGAKPTHPVLLDWLATELHRRDWRLKPIHRLLLTSGVYQQRSVHPQELQYRRRDAGNRLWWRANRRRLDAEALRDSLLAVNQDLDLRLAGPGFRPTISPEATEGLSRKAAAWKASPIGEQLRRSVYMYSQRSLLPPLMTVFDLGDTTLPCAKRDVTTVAPQALAMMNHRFHHQRSGALAKRILSDAPADDRSRVQWIWRLALGRRADDLELDSALRYLDQQRPRFGIGRNEKTAAAGVRQPTEKDWRRQTQLTSKNGLTLHLQADQGVLRDDQGRVESWRDLSAFGHHGSQSDPAKRPSWIADNGAGRATVRFDGKARFLKLKGPLLSSPESSFFVVANDSGPPQHRELISNWNGAAGNSTRSMFLGLTGMQSVRFSDQFAPAGKVVAGHNLFLLTAINAKQHAAVFQNANLIAQRREPLSDRRLDTPWVIGQQGNIGGEYWRGDIVEILVYDRALSDAERKQVWGYLLNRYQLSKRITQTVLSDEQRSPELLLWSSLCQVVLNSNEFLYVD